MTPKAKKKFKEDIKKDLLLFNWDFMKCIKNVSLFMLIVISLTFFKVWQVLDQSDWNSFQVYAGAFIALINAIIICISALNLDEVVVLISSILVAGSIIFDIGDLAAIITWMVVYLLFSSFYHLIKQIGDKFKKQ